MTLGNRSYKIDRCVSFVKGKGHFANKCKNEKLENGNLKSLAQVVHFQSMFEECPALL